MITFEEKLDKLLAKKSQLKKGNGQNSTPGKPDSRYKTRPDPVPVSDYTFYLLYLLYL